MENSSINIVICFHFQVMGIDDYLTLHAYIHSDPLPHTMRLLRDVVIVSAIRPQQLISLCLPYRHRYPRFSAWRTGNSIV